LCISASTPVIDLKQPDFYSQETSGLANRVNCHLIYVRSNCPDPSESGISASELNVSPEGYHALIERLKIIAVKRKAKLQDVAAEAFETWVRTAEREGTQRK
jgi:hypothetical protein